MKRLAPAVLAVLCSAVVASGCQAFASFDTPRETGEQCNDGFDNDGNGLTDCADPSCAGSTSCGPIDAGTADGSQAADANSQMNASALLTPAQGGIVQLPNGAGVIIPPGALDTATTITVTQINPPGDSNIIPVGPTIVLGPEGLTFESPVTVNLPVDSLPANFTDADVVGLTAPANGAGSEQYALLFGPTPSNRLSVQTTHFSQFLPAVIVTTCWNRSISADPTTVSADGQATTTITVLQHACPSLAYGQLIGTVSVSGTDNKLSLQQGLVTFGGGSESTPLVTTLSSDVGETKQVVVTLAPETQPNLIVGQVSVPVTFVGQSPSPATSQLVFGLANGVADGVSPVKVTVILDDDQGNPVKNFPVKLGASNGALLDPPFGSTDSEGNFVSQLTSSNPGTVTVSMQLAPLLSKPIDFIAACSNWVEANTNASPAQLQSIFGTGGSDIWAVGQAKTVLHFDGASWQSESTGSAPTTKTYFGVWAADTAHAWAVGTGLISTFVDGTWQESVVAPTYFGVWGLDASHVWIVGASGSILFWDGANLFEQNSPILNDVNVNAISIGGADPSDVWVGTRDSSNVGSILFWDGEGWTTQFSGGQFTGVRGIVALSPSDVWAVGDNGMTLHFDGSAWGPFSSGTAQNLNAVWGTDTDHVWAVGNDSTILFWNGFSWVDQSPAFAGADLLGVWGIDSAHVAAVGALGADLAQLSCSSGT